MSPVPLPVCGRRSLRGGERLVCVRNGVGERENEGVPRDRDGCAGFTAARVRSGFCGVFQQIKKELFQKDRVADNVRTAKAFGRTGKGRKKGLHAGKPRLKRL